MVLHSQTVHVSVAHRYWNSEWSVPKNQQVYGRLASEVGVGSNLELTLTTPLAEDPSEQLKKLKSLIDHKCLYLDEPEFLQAPSTTEAIAQFLANRIEGPWHCLKLIENKKWAVIIEPDKPSVLVEEKAFNLMSRRRLIVDLSSRLAGPRDALEKAARLVAPAFAEARPNETEPEWAKRFASALANTLSGLEELRIDIGGQRFLRVHL